jgi:hypothetical protein
MRCFRLCERCRTGFLTLTILQMECILDAAACAVPLRFVPNLFRQQGRKTDNR